MVSSTSMVEHDERCRVITWAMMVVDADTKGDPVPESVRRLAENENSGLVKCHPNCPVWAQSVARGLELAEKYGWQ